MFWKIYFWFYVSLGVLGILTAIFSPQYSFKLGSYSTWLITFIIEQFLTLLTAIGLFGLAFQKKILTPTLWIVILFTADFVEYLTLFLGAFASYTLLEVSIGYLFYIPATLGIMFYAFKYLPALIQLSQLSQSQKV